MSPNSQVSDIRDYLGTIEGGKVGGVNSSEEYIDEVMEIEKAYTKEYLERVSD